MGVDEHILDAEVARREREWGQVQGAEKKTAPELAIESAIREADRVIERTQKELAETALVIEKATRELERWRATRAEHVKALQILAFHEAK